MTDESHSFQGNRDSVVVFIHGQPGTARDFDEVAERLPATIKILSYDRPGWGESHGGATDVIGNVNYLLKLLLSKGIERVVLVGYSYGTTVALRAAVDFPERIAGLVLVSPVGSVESISVVDRVLAFTAGCIQHVPIIHRLIGQNKDRIRLIESFYSEQVCLSDDLQQLSTQISSIALPVDLVVGMDDFFNPLRGTMHLFDSLPNARLTLLKGVGHLLLNQTPEMVAGSVFGMWSDCGEH